MTKIRKNAKFKLRSQHTLEIDEFDRIMVSGSTDHLLLNTDTADSGKTRAFSEVFSDSNTRRVLIRVLQHVRETGETVSYPYRCDSKTHHIYHRCIVFKSSSQCVAFVSQLISEYERPNGAVWDRIMVEDNQDYIACSLCNRLLHRSGWREFQQLVDKGLWAASGQPMRCSTGICQNCEDAIEQRLHESIRCTQQAA